MDTSEPTKRTRVRAYAPEFKAQVLAECSQPGASIAKVARVNGLNANMIHTWRREARDRVAPAVAGGGEFVPLQLASSPVAAAVPPIRIELRQGATTVAIAWPVEAVDSCATWLRAPLR
jgi:transposase